MNPYHTLHSIHIQYSWQNTEICRNRHWHLYTLYDLYIELGVDNSVVASSYFKRGWWWLEDQSILVVLKTTSNKTEVGGGGHPPFHPLATTLDNTCAQDLYM